MLGNGLVQKGTERTQQFTHVRTLGGEQRQTMYVRSLEMSPRSAGWEGEQRETTAAMYARTYVRKDVPTYVRTYASAYAPTYVRRPNARRRTPPKHIHTYECTCIRTTYVRTYERTYVREVHRSPPLRLPISRLSMRTAVCFCEPPFWIPVRLTVPERNVAHMPDLDGEKQPVGKVGVAVGAIAPPTMFKRQPFPHVRYVRN